MRHFRVDVCLEPGTPAESHAAVDVDARDGLRAHGRATRAISANVARFRVDAVREVVAGLQGVSVRVHCLDGVWQF